MRPRAQILFIGIDAGEKSLLLEWAAEGVLPSVKRLLQRQAWATVLNPAGLYSGSVWPSFYTARHPGHHGRYSSGRFCPSTYESRPFAPHAVRGEPLWDALSRQGKRVAVIDVPKSYPSENLNGVQLVDWGSHAPQLDFCTSPPELAAEIVERYGRHPLSRREVPRRTIAECLEARNGLLAGVRTKAEFCSHFLEQGGWDLFITVFGESHCIGHQCWHLHDPTHPAWCKDVVQAVGDPVRDVYVAIDEAIGDLVERAGPEATTFLYANNGMTARTSGAHLLDDVLRAIERADISTARRAVGTALSWSASRLPNWGRTRLRPLWQPMRRTVGEALVAAENPQRRCFQVFTNESTGGIRINVAGRESQGRVQPGAEYEALCDSLTRDLLDLVNADTGKPAVCDVIRPRALYPGDAVESLPDLIVDWCREAPIGGVRSAKIGTIRSEYRGPRSGDHTPDGLLIAAGPSIQHAQLERTIGVTELAPILATLLGCSMPLGR